MIVLGIAAVAVILLGGALYQARAAARDLRRVPPTGQLVDLGGGRRLHAHCSGAGAPAVILEAGIAASSLSWTRVQPRVAQFTRVCSYDRAGLGWSDPGRSPLSAAANAESLHLLLRALGIPLPYVLVGHSYGSFIIREYANRYRNEVAGIVLVDPIWPSEWVQPTRELQRRLRGGVFLSHVGGLLARVGFVRVCLRLLTGGAPGLARRASRLFGSEASGVLSRLVGEVQKLPAETWPLVQALWSQPKCFTAMARHLAALPRSAGEQATCGELGDIPTLVITGGRQPEQCRAEQQRLAALSSRWRQIVAAGSGHWVHFDEPELVIEAIREVVNDVCCAGKHTLAPLVNVKSD